MDGSLHNSSNVDSELGDHTMLHSLALCRIIQFGGKNASDPRRLTYTSERDKYSEETFKSNMAQMLCFMKRVVLKKTQYQKK